MTNEQIKQICLANGFKLKQQPDGSMDLNPYVYDAVNAVIAAIDPFATLHFYQAKSGSHVAHGKSRMYVIRYSEKHVGYFCHYGIGLKLTHWLDTSISKLQQAQAWCQADYDKYYKGLSDD